MIQCNRFAYSTGMKTLETAADNLPPAEYKDVLVGFIHMEEKDIEDIKGREKKLVNTLKWAARKNECNKVILHSFAHLSESKAPPDKTLEIFNLAQKRLENGGYETYQTPFGYFLNLEIDAPGHSFARLFKEL
jgi:hypothetical protein